MEPVVEIRCASCGGELVVGRCAEIKLQNNEQTRTLKTWWICSARCAYFLGARHTAELLELERQPRPRRRRAPVPFRSRGGRA